MVAMNTATLIILSLRLLFYVCMFAFQWLTLCLVPMSHRGHRLSHFLCQGRPGKLAPLSVVHLPSSVPFTTPVLSGLRPRSLPNLLRPKFWPPYCWFSRILVFTLGLGCMRLSAHCTCTPAFCLTDFGFALVLPDIVFGIVAVSLRC